MLTLNLINVEKSDIKYTISHFPDGEIQIALGEFSRKEAIVVYCKITNSDELFLLMQVNDILTRHGVRWGIHITYLMGARMDRVMDFNRPFTLKIMLEILKGFSCAQLAILELHSMESLEAYPTFKSSFFHPNFSPLYPRIYEENTVVFPDRGAYNRYKCNEIQKHEVVICEKIRDETTGQLKDFKITNPEVVLNSEKPLMIIDDLCDAGGTFCGIASKLKEIKPDATLNIFVTHMVNPKGIENLSKVFDHVYFTDSYKDWKEYWEKHQSVPFPENVTQFKIIEW